MTTISNTQISIVIVSRHASISLTRAFSGVRIRAVAVPDLASAQREVFARPYDGVVIDREQAIDVAAFVRQVRETSSIPIVIVVSTLDVAERIAALDAGADDVLIALTGIRELSLRVTAAVHRARRSSSR